MVREEGRIGTRDGPFATTFKALMKHVTEQEVQIVNKGYPQKTLKTLNTSAPYLCSQYRPILLHFL